MPRPSHVRDAVQNLLSSSRRHDWSADEVFVALGERSIAADFSSVCRGLAYLEREGVIRRVDLGSDKARYEAAREHHDHVRCQICGAVAEVPGCVVERAHRSVEEETSYRVTGHSLVFFGICPECEGRR